MMIKTFRIKRCLIICLITALLVSMPFFIKPANATQTYTANTFSTAAASSGSSSATSASSGDLVVYFMSGDKQYSYLAFDFSAFPQDATPVSATLKIKCHVASTACYISAFAGLSSDWIGQNLTWDNKPTIGSYIDANWVNTINEYYTYTSDSLNSVASTACTNKGYVSIELKTGIGSNDEDGLVLFYPNATLEVSYTTNTITPNPTATITSSPSVPEFPSMAIMLVLAIGVLVSAVVYRKKIANSKLTTRCKVLN